MQCSKNIATPRVKGQEGNSVIAKPLYIESKQNNKNQGRIATEYGKGAMQGLMVTVMRKMWEGNVPRPL